jgi:hypothetical protein
MSIGFCVWVFQLAQLQQVNHVNLRAAFYYQIFPEASGPDMISMTIRFTPHIIASADPYGLALGDPADVSQCDTAVQFANRFSSVVDVDQNLTVNVDLRQNLIDESAALLVDAGYDEAQYRQWVAQFSS